MTWHILYDSWTQDMFDYVHEEGWNPSVSGLAFLRPRDYADWKTCGASGSCPGHVFGPLDGQQQLRRERSIDGWRLSNLHRVTPSLPTVADLQQKPGGIWEPWLRQQPVHDVDRFFKHYECLEPSAIRWFEQRLRYDPPTAQALVGLEVLFEDGGDECLLGTAAAAAMFHRSEALTGRLPAALDDDVRAVIHGHGSRVDLRRHCGEHDTRAAAAALHAVCRWVEGKKPSGWALELLWGEISAGRDGDLEDARARAEQRWAEPEGWWVEQLA